MSDQDQSAEKSFEPTAKRLEDARKKGDVPQSRDITTAAAYFGFVIALFGFGATAVSEFADPLILLISQSHSLNLLPVGWSGPGLLGAILPPMSGLLIALFLAPAAFALLALFAQRAIVFSPSKLVPKLSRISPIQGAKNKFGANGFFEFLKASAKLCLVSVGAFLFVVLNLEEMLSSTAETDGQLAAHLGAIILEFSLLACIAMAAIGAADYFWQVFEHRRKNMMTRKDIEDEAKDAEGDPHFKQARRSRAQEIAMNSMLADVPDADVVIVNPTHFSVALKWDRSSERAPICVAKGLDEVALRIRQIAKRSKVPIYSDPPTARAIFATVDLGQQIRSDHYRAVAAAVRYAERARKEARKVVE